MNNLNLQIVAKFLQKNCKKRTTCYECPFNSSGVDDECDIAFSNFANEKAAKPKDWDI